jgi:hypothetical protein
MPVGVELRLGGLDRELQDGLQFDLLLPERDLSLVDS